MERRVGKALLRAANTSFCRAQQALMCLMLCEAVRMRVIHDVVVVQPEGEGKYVWADQSTYEGGWKVCTSFTSSPVLVYLLDSCSA